MKRPGILIGFCVIMFVYGTVKHLEAQRLSEEVSETRTLADEQRKNALELARLSTLERARSDSTARIAMIERDKYNQLAACVEKKYGKSELESLLGDCN